MGVPVVPRLWPHTYPDDRSGCEPDPIHVGRQGVYTSDGGLFGYELLFRAAGLPGAHVDQWTAAEQDLATEHVIAAAFHQGRDITNGLDVSVNFTGSYLLGREDLACDPDSVIIEVVESTELEPGLIERVQHFRDLGFRIALDDFTATAAQSAILPMADFVKIDLRDLLEFGPTLVDQARGHGRTLVAEQVETESQLDALVAMGFDQFQGFYFQTVEVLDIPSANAGDSGR